MLIRSKAPLRLGLAGGGTDVDPYSEYYGGSVLNATINLYAYSTIRPRSDGFIELYSPNTNERFRGEYQKILDIDGELSLLKGVYNRLQMDYDLGELSFNLETYTEAPPGSGLGSSSTLVVSMIGAFVEWLNLPLSDYDIAKLAYLVERKDLDMAGGKQDQYAATFGGFNFMEFGPKDRVIVNPLRINKNYMNELQMNLLLYNTGQSRFSSDIIEAQSNSISQSDKRSLEAMHKIKEDALRMKELILTGNIDEIGINLGSGWKNKKMSYKGVTNNLIDEIYSLALKEGSSGGKISGAGGGGFLMLYCPNNSRDKVVRSIIKKFGGEFKRFEFNIGGLQTWTI